MESGGTGGSKEHPFSWKQTLEEVTISLPVPEGTRGKMLAVEITQRGIKASLKFKGETLIDGELFNDVAVDESTWSVVDQKELSITLEKQKQTEWWPHVLTTDPKVDVTKIEPEKSQLSDLDTETRQMVEKMMEQQRNPKPSDKSPEEEERQKILEQFKKQNPNLDFSKVENNANF